MAAIFQNDKLGARNGVGHKFGVDDRRDITLARSWRSEMTWKTSSAVLIAWRNRHIHDPKLGRIIRRANTASVA